MSSWELVMMATRLEELQVNELVRILEHWDMEEFVPFVREKNINGKKLMDVSKETVKQWSTAVRAEAFIVFIQNMKQDPKYLNYLKSDDVIKIKETNICLESQYQTVCVRKISQQENSNFSTVEEILRKITAPKSFLYRNQQKRAEKAMTSYVPMDNKDQKKKFFRASSYDYPIFDFKSRISKNENVDRGYYLIKTNNKNNTTKSYRNADTTHKYNSLPSNEISNDKDITEDHFYEDLCYNDVKDEKEINKETQVKTCLVHQLQELFQSFKLPFFKKTEVVVPQLQELKEELNLYENENVDHLPDAMYDSIHPSTEIYRSSTEMEKTGSFVEDYLVPVQLVNDYCDVSLKQKDDSLLGFIMNYFETRFGTRKESNETAQSEESEVEAAGDVGDVKWDRKASNMAARPLPVPVENEPYYMRVDRSEAENLLLGQPDGTFILRPSSQPNHAYTLTVSCSSTVHNVGIRRRPDGRLALGYARRGERSFSSITALLQHHKKRRLLLVSGGELIGATTLNDTPQYYQTPKSIAMIPRL